MAEVGDEALWSCVAGGCSAVRMGAHDRCLAHLDEPKLQQALSDLQPGADVDVRGVRFSAGLLERLLGAARGDPPARPTFGTARFGRAEFTEDAAFGGVDFQGPASFLGARFAGRASFESAQFHAGAWFDDARFEDQAIFDGSSFQVKADFNTAHSGSMAWFRNVQVSGDAGFYGAVFHGAKISESDDRPHGADFRGATFGRTVSMRQACFLGHALFSSVRFGGDTRFDGVQVDGDADFSGAQFDATERLGPIVVSRTLSLARARFGQTVQIQAAASTVKCQHATFAQHATLLLRHAEIVLDDIISAEPLTLAAAGPFTAPGQAAPMDEAALRLRQSAAAPRLISLDGVDCSRLILVDVELSNCHFAGALRLDQLRVEGDCRFANAPADWRHAAAWPPIWRWTRRQILAEERQWRTATAHPIRWPSAGPAVDPRPRLEPERLAVLYRQLRKAQEDAKDEPGAADFYYGEMEMRRHAQRTASGERIILFLYWLVSGYALRATRALAFLAAVIAAATALLAAYGLPGHGQHGGSGSRIDQALLIALNAVVFRAAGQPLTTAGAHIELAARIAGPVLLALVILAIRNRVKR